MCEINQLAEHQKSVNSKINKQMANYYQMMNKCKDIYKQFELVNAENIIFKNIGLRFTAKVNELTGQCNVTTTSIDSPIVYNVSTLKESYNTLTNQLYVIKVRGEQMSRELTDINDQLAKLDVMRTWLTERCEKITTLSEVEEIRQDRTVGDIRVIMKQMSAYLNRVESRVDHEQWKKKLRGDALRQIINRAVNYSQEAKRCIAGICVDNDRLAHELQKSKIIVDTLYLRMSELDELQASRPAKPDLSVEPNHHVVLDSPAERDCPGIPDHSIELDCPVVPYCPIETDCPIESDQLSEDYGKLEGSLRNECKIANRVLQLHACDNDDDAHRQQSSASTYDSSVDELQSYSASIGVSSSVDELPSWPHSLLSSSYDTVDNCNNDFNNDMVKPLKPLVTPAGCHVLSLDQLICKYANSMDIINS
ncbi:Hypothetical protein CINCED_3A010739 [Cinara cedri]|uniref:Uncharacterized protein n=1 Tax=Cinara cedri TaxID=506608 RepID=A0A5E4MBN8_9HEMI|nr:Hypothetical protein CINCED_3A010739 [Cinara cedri]